MSHSPEPWGIDPESGAIVDANGSFVGDNCPDDPGPMEDADIERIVACVNAHDALLAQLHEVIGFCVAFREDSTCWREHPDVGRLFARVKTTIASEPHTRPEAPQASKPAGDQS